MAVGGPLGAKRCKLEEEGGQEGSLGTVINIQQLSSPEGITTMLALSTASPPVCPLHARKQMECERSGRRLQSSFIQLAGLSK